MNENAREENGQGLNAAEAARRLRRYGPNQIFVPTPVTFFGIARHEVTEPMILLLLVVGFFYSIWGKVEDAFTIFLVIFLLILAEVYNEYRAKKAIASLQQIAAPRARVTRDGRVIELETEGVVPGDDLVLLMGTHVPADGKVTTSIGLQIDESALSGEAFPRVKKEGDEVYAGTIVVSGEGRAEVVVTGKRTKLGRIAATLPSVKPPKTALQLAMKSLAKKLVFVALFFSVLIPILGILQGHDIRTMFLTGLSLSFATIPEELPIIITMVLGLGAYTLSRSNFLVKKIDAAETLGNTTVIVTDKTGTITEGVIKIVSVYPEGREKEVLATAVGSLSRYILSPLEEEIRNQAENLNIRKSFSKPVKERLIGENGRKTKGMIRRLDGGYEVVVSGAPEEVFALCEVVPEGAKEELKEQASRGRRVIGVASRWAHNDVEEAGFPEMERDLELAGLISFEDPAREGVRETVDAAARAGIRTIMVTGDHPLTAAFIARSVDIPGDNVVTGKELDGMDDRALREAVRRVSVFARVSPEHKFRIVRTLQDEGEVVAATGDGINDVLALKGADIGIAMGIKGTDVAKDAAAVVLADDNYVTILRGILEGRGFFNNLRKGIKYYLAVKTALVLIFLVPILFGLPMPFSPIQIILLELFMDLAASAGFVAEPQERDVYSSGPRRRKETILSRPAILDVLMKGVVLFLAVMAVYFYAVLHGFSPPQVQTYAFSAWMFGHVFLAFVSRSDKDPVWSTGVLGNRIIDLWAGVAIAFVLVGSWIPVLRDRMGFVKMDGVHLLGIGAVTAAILGLLEVRKYFGRNKGPGG